MNFMHRFDNICRSLLGLKSAPSVYQRAIDKALGELRNQFAVAYIDDVLIPSSTVSEGLKRLESVMDALVNAGFSFNVKKCKIPEISD